MLSTSRSLVFLTMVFCVAVYTSARAQSADVGPCKARSISTLRDAKGGQSTTTQPVENSPCVSPKAAEGLNIAFEGLTAVAIADALTLFREQGIDIPAKGGNDVQLINRAANVLQDALHARGYMDASVAGYKVEKSKGIRFVVDEGIQYPITSVIFVGNKIFGSDVLAAEFRQSYDNYRSFYDRYLVEWSLRRVAFFLRQRGYLQARLSPPSIQVIGAGVSLKITLTEGRLYRLGDIQVEGANALSIEDIRSMLGRNKGDIADGDQLSKWLFEDLKQVYGEKGFIQYTAEIVPTFKDNPFNSDEGVVDIMVQLEEGKRFVLRSIRFEGESVTERQMNDLLALRVGDFYNDRLYSESISRINKSGLFEPVDRDRDANFATNQEDGTVALVINLKKKSNPSSQ